MLALVLALVVGGVLVILRLGEVESPDAPAPSPGAAQAPAQAPYEPILNNGGRIDHIIDPEYKDLPRTFDGRGKVTGSVEVLGGKPFPDTWRLVFQPSSFGTAREHAEHRVREFDGVERTFEELDLPLGGYTVYAEADGLNSRPQEVLLYGIPGSPIGGKIHAHLILHLTPTGFMDGSVRDESGAPVADLPVVLEDLGDRSKRETLTTGAGVWRFDDLRDGRYKLYYGHVENPLIPVRHVNYNAPQRRLEDHLVPVTASVAFQLLDHHGLVVHDAKVRGFGPPGGQVMCESGPDGVAVARFLPAGRYQVTVENSEGLEGKANFELQGDEVLHRVQIILSPVKR